MNFPHVPCIKENSREFRVFRVTCPSALCAQNIPEEETIHLSSDKTQTSEDRDMPIHAIHLLNLFVWNNSSET